MSRYCVEKARWEEYVRGVRMEEAVIQAMWTEHQVLRHKLFNRNNLAFLMFLKIFL